MADDDIFVKRVDFEVNNNETAGNAASPLLANGSDAQIDLEKLELKGDEAPKKVPTTCGGKFMAFLEKFGIKAALGHASLLFGLGLYCYVGGCVFVRLEHPALKEREEVIRQNITIERRIFIKEIIDANENNNLDVDYLSDRLQHYESIAQLAVQGNLQLISSIDNSTEAFPVENVKWTILQAIFFAATICTTIGYGNIAPETFEGRLFCVIFAIFGLPFTLTVIADFGQIFANSVSAIAKKCKTLKMCNKDSKVRKMRGRKWLYAIGAVMFLGIYLSAGAAVFEKSEDWTFFNSFYFSFITLTTIGLGDLVPNERLMLYCTVYILIGLALTSTIIELVRRQYVRSWQKLQQLKLGSFADSLRLLGTSHGAIDVNDLKSILSMVSMAKRGGKNDKKEDDKEIDTLEALTKAILQEVKIKQMEKPKLVQIIIYESSV